MDEHLTTSSSTEAQTLNEASQPIEASASQSTPETIPYARFKEVNDKFRTTEQELTSLRGELDTHARLNQELNAALMLLQQQGINTQPAQNTNDVQIDPYEYWQAAEQNPLAWEQTLSQRIMSQVMDTFSKQQKVETTVKSAVDQTLQKYPDLNNEKGKYFLENYARFLDEQVPSHVPVAQVFEMAANEINQFISGFRSQGIQESEARLKEAKTQEKLQAFTEGSGNLIPPDDPYQTALTKAKKTGNVEDLIRVKVQRMNAAGV